MTDASASSLALGWPATTWVVGLLKHICTSFYVSKVLKFCKLLCLVWNIFWKLIIPISSWNTYLWQSIPEIHTWRRGVVVITTTQLYSTKPELRFCTGSNPAHGVSEIHDGEDLWQWSWLEIRLKAFCQSTIPQKQFIIIITSCIRIFALTTNSVTNPIESNSVQLLFKNFIFVKT